MNWNDIFISSSTMLEHESWAEPSDFARALDIFDTEYSDEFSKRVKKFYVVGANWICTDTRVGLAVYLFDDMPVAVSAQPARKSDETVEFVSREAAMKMREYILSLSDPQLTVIDDMTGTLDQGWFNKNPSRY